MAEETIPVLSLASLAGFHVDNGRAYIPTISEDVTNLLETFAKLVKATSPEQQGSQCKGIPRQDCGYLTACDKVCNKCGEVHKHHQMVAQFYEMEKDAKRYRWLREQHWSDNLIAVVYSPKDKVRLGTDCPSETRLDDLIDGIMKD